MAGKIVCLLLAVAFATVSGKPGHGRIIGGEEAMEGEFPSLVQIKRVGTHFCSGAILDAEWIVTAAHCATGRPADYMIVAGAHDRNGTNGQTRQVFRVVSHPLYDTAESADFEHDIALMQVLPPFNWSDTVQPGKFASAGFTPESASGVIAGWGFTTEDGEPSDVLMRAAVPLVSDQACNVAYGGDAVTPNMICAGGNGVDFCTGDSGGPLLCSNGSTSDVVCGVMSWGLGCGRQGFPGVYTETSFFADWLAEGILPEPEDNSTYVEQREGCGGNLVGSSGLIEYELNGQHTANERCTWFVRANMRETVRLNLTASEGFGPGTYLEITQVSPDTAKTGDRSRLEPETSIVLVPGPMILITLVSNTSDVGGSFSLPFQGLGEQGSSDLDWSHFHAGNDTGSFAYPAGGGQYGNNELNTFVINPPTGELNMVWDRLNMEASSCAYDMLNIHTHTAEGFNSISTVCGTTLPPPTVSDGVIVLIMKTDSSVTGTGFQVSW